MIALDTNLLVYAIRPELPQHAVALRVVKRLVEGEDFWLLPWPCVHEFLAVTTHHRIFKPPTEVQSALNFISRLLASPRIVVGTETEAHWQIICQLLEGAGTSGPSVHDARIAAICIGNNVTHLYTADRDFAKIPGLKTVNPLID